MATEGIHPVTDLVFFGQHPFPPDIEALVSELLALNIAVFDDVNSSSSQRQWELLLRNMANGKDLEKGREALQAEISRQSQRPG